MAPRMRGVANVSNLTPTLGIETLDGIDQPEHAGADEITGIDAATARPAPSRPATNFTSGE